jgi:CNT family concentrative nucleoside transporter
MSPQAQSAIGLVAIPLFAWLLSEKRAAIAPARLARLLLAGIGLQLAIAGVMLNVPGVRGAFDWAAGLVTALQSATGAGVQLVFGYLAGAPAPFQIANPQHTFILAFHALPLILVISALTKLLYHWGILQRVVHAVGWVLRRTMGVTGPVGTSAAANIFVGMVEAPLLVRPYLAGMSRAGLFATMTVGMAGVAGTVLAIYATIMRQTVPGVAGHLIVASVISVPAALLLAELIVPRDAAWEHAPASCGEPDDDKIVIDDAPRSSMDAIAQGTWEGVMLLANVTAMLIVAVALVALANQLLGLIAAPLGLQLTFQQVLGWALAPLAWRSASPGLNALRLGPCSE